MFVSVLRWQYGEKKVWFICIILLHSYIYHIYPYICLYILIYLCIYIYQCIFVYLCINVAYLLFEWDMYTAGLPETEIGLLDHDNDCDRDCDQQSEPSTTTGTDTTTTGATTTGTTPVGNQE